MVVMLFVSFVCGDGATDRATAPASRGGINGGTPSIIHARTHIGLGDRLLQGGQRGLARLARLGPVLLLAPHPCFGRRLWMVVVWVGGVSGGAVYCVYVCICVSVADAAVAFARASLSLFRLGEGMRRVDGLSMQCNGVASASRRFRLPTCPRSACPPPRQKRKHRGTGLEERWGQRHGGRRWLLPPSHRPRQHRRRRQRGASRPFRSRRTRRRRRCVVWSNGCGVA